MGNKLNKKDTQTQISCQGNKKKKDFIALGLTELLVVSMDLSRSSLNIG